MNHDAHAEHRMPDERKKSFWGSPSGLITLFCIGAVVVYLLTEHTAHVYGVLPYLVLLACPLMHLFMHHDHGGHSEKESCHKGATAKPEEGKRGDW